MAGWPARGSVLMAASVADFRRLLARGGEARCPTGCSTYPARTPSRRRTTSTWSWPRPTSGGSTGTSAPTTSSSTTGCAGCSASTPRPSTTGSPRSGPRCTRTTHPSVEAAVAAALDDLQRVPGGVPGPAAGRSGPLGRGPRPGPAGRGRPGRADARGRPRLQRPAAGQGHRRPRPRAHGRRVPLGRLRLAGHLRQPQRRGLRRADGRGAPAGSCGRCGRTWPRPATSRWSARPRAPARRTCSRSTSWRRDRWFQVRVVPHQDGLSFFATDVTATRAAELERERALTRPDQARAVLAYSAGARRGRHPRRRHRGRRHDGAAGLRRRPGCSCRCWSPTGSSWPATPATRSRRSSCSTCSSPDEDLPDRRGAADPRARCSCRPGPRTYGKYPGRAELIEATGKQAWAFLPLTVSGRALGSLTVSFDQPRDFPPDERSLLVSVSGLLAQTLARARLRDHERTLAAELQQQLLPRALPQPAGAGRHRPLPGRHRRDGGRRRLVRRAGAAGPPGRPRHRRRAGPHHAGRRRDGAAAQRAAGLRRRGSRARRGDVPHQPADGRPRPRGVRHLRHRLGRPALVADRSWCSPVTRRRSGARLPAPPRCWTHRSGHRWASSQGEEYASGVVTPGPRRHPRAVHRRPGRGLGPDLRRGPGLGAADPCGRRHRRPRAARGHADRRRPSTRTTAPTTSRMLVVRHDGPARGGPPGARPGPRSTGATPGRPGPPGTSSPPTWPARAGRAARDRGAAGLRGGHQRAAAHPRPRRARAVAVRRPGAGRGVRRDLARPGRRPAATCSTSPAAACR